MTDDNDGQPETEPQHAAPKGPFFSESACQKPINVIPLSERRVTMADYTKLQSPGTPASVSSINDARDPVWYDIAVCHHWDGSIQTWVRAVGLDDPEDRKKIAIALRQAADGLDEPRVS